MRATSSLISSRLLRKRKAELRVTTPRDHECVKGTLLPNTWNFGWIEGFPTCELQHPPAAAITFREGFQCSKLLRRQRWLHRCWPSRPRSRMQRRHRVSRPSLRPRPALFKFRIAIGSGANKFAAAATTADSEPANAIARRRVAGAAMTAGRGTGGRAAASSWVRSGSARKLQSMGVPRLACCGTLLFVSRCISSTYPSS
jgi:hypothetical protein